MFRAELNQRWGMYCDTDKLVANMMMLLTKYHHACTEYGVCEVLDTYFTNKKHLIDMFLESDNYIGDMRICVDVELERGLNPNEIKEFLETFCNKVNASSVFYEYKDENGKTLQDYIRVGMKRFKARELCYGHLSNILLENLEHRKKFTHNGITMASKKKYDSFWSAIYDFRYSPTKNLNQNTVDALTQYEINGKFVEGMKTSRAFNRLCSIYGVDRLPNYNKLFAEYSDMVSGLKRKMKFYISLNPLDYLTMSFGNSWSSCHTIDKRNERNMPNSYSGMHCGGVMSYMLDGTSIITYALDHEMQSFEDGKIYRNMFHFEDGLLVQGRIYPQGNDGATDLYKTFRRFMQIELTKMLDVYDDWYKKSCECSDHVVSTGVHYRDYENFDGCNVSYNRNVRGASMHVITVGHSRICPYCGDRIEDSVNHGVLTHAHCELNF